MSEHRRLDEAPRAANPRVLRCRRPAAWHIENGRHARRVCELHFAVWRVSHKYDMRRWQYFGTGRCQVTERVKA